MTYPIIPPYPSFAWRDILPIHTDRFTVFYDRAKLFVFDVLSHEMQIQAVAKTHFSTLVLGLRGVFFYDGKQLVGYCGPARSFVTEPTVFDPFARGYLDKSTDFSTIRVAGANYRLYPSRCEIQN